jgi:hypothetical protein
MIWRAGCTAALRLHSRQLRQLRMYRLGAHKLRVIFNNSRVFQTAKQRKLDDSDLLPL